MSVVDEVAYANAIASFVTEVQAHVAVARERDALLALVADLQTGLVAALARLDAVRAVLDRATAPGQSLRETAIFANIRKALDGGAETPPLEPGPYAVGRPGAVPGTQVTPDPPGPLSSAPTEGAP